MPQYRFSIGDDLRSAILDLPRDTRDSLRRGLRIVTSRIPTAENELLDLAVQTSYPTYGPSPASLAKSLSLAQDEAETLLHALSFIAFVVGSKRTADDLVPALVDTRVLDSTGADSLSGLVTKLRERRKDLRRGLDMYLLANAILPSLEVVETKVDLRIDFRAAGQPLTVPVAIVHLVTDTGDRLVLQLLHSDVRNLVRDLQMLATQLDTLEKNILEKEFARPS